jgi:hypothetical protein
VTQAVECLPSKHKALSSNPVATKKEEVERRSELWKENTYKRDWGRGWGGSLNYIQTGPDGIPPEGSSESSQQGLVM